MCCQFLQFIEQCRLNKSPSSKLVRLFQSITVINYSRGQSSSITILAVSQNVCLIRGYFRPFSKLRLLTGLEHRLRQKTCAFVIELQRATRSLQPKPTPRSSVSNPIPPTLYNHRHLIVNKCKTKQNDNKLPSSYRNTKP